MSASDFPISFGYGAVDGRFYGPHGTIGPYHRGVDRVMPVGTPVVVNGVQIGLSGNSGASSGAHLHVGRFIGAKDTDPGRGGFSFDSAVVVTVAGDATNGNYVRLQADGASWVYLHLSKQTCVVGQVLSPAPPAPKGDDVAIVQNSDNWFGRFNKTMNQIRGRDASREELVPFVGQDFLHVVEAIEDNPEADQATAWQNLGKNAAGQLAAQQTTIDTLHSQVDSLSQELAASKLQLSDATSKNVMLETHLEAAKQTPAPVPQNTPEPAKGTPNWLAKLLATFIK